MRAPVSARQIRAVWSTDAVTTRLPSSLNDGASDPFCVTVELGDEAARVGTPEPRALSRDAVTTRLPRSLNAAELTQFVCPLSSAMRRLWRLARSAPYCPRRSYDTTAVRAECGGSDHARVSSERGDEGARISSPDPRSLVARCGDDVAAILAERGGTDYSRVTVELEDDGAGLGLPDPRSPVHRCGDDAAAILAEQRASDLACVSIELGDEAPVSARQIRAVWSTDAVTTRLPSSLNAAVVTVPVCPLSSATRDPVSARQIRAVLSRDAVAMRLPSLLNAALLTHSVCPLSSATRDPVSARQIRAVLSRDAVAMRLPSLLNAARIDPFCVSLELGDEVARIDPPDPRCLVPRCGDDAAAVLAERGGSDHVRVSNDRLESGGLPCQESQALAHHHLS